MRAISLGKAADLLSLWSILVNTLAVLATILVIVLDGRKAAVIALLIPFAIIVWRQRRALVAPRGIGGVSRYLTARHLLIAAAAVHLYAAGAPQVVSAVICVLVIISLALEPVIRSLNGIAVPYASSFPGHAPRERVEFRFGWIFTVNVFALLVLVISVLDPMILLPLAGAITLVALVINAIALADITRSIRERRRFQADLAGILEEMRPVFYVYWHAPPRSAFQVTMWLPYLDRIGVPYVLVARTVPTFRQLAEATDHPVILRRALTDLDDLIVPSVRGVFYVNNAMRNNHMVRYTQLTHIQLLHGESDKASSVTPIIRMYDRDFVAGQAAIDRFETFGVPMPPDIFRIVGRPQVEDVAEARGPIGELPDRTVLYAPTWLGYQAETNYSSLPVGPDIVAALLERECRVVFRPHPYAARSPELREACEQIFSMLEADAARTGREHLYGPRAEKEMSLVDCFNAADAMISDVSAVVGDFLHSGKPLAMVSPRTGAEEFVSQFPMARAAYVIVAEGAVLPNLGEVLADLTGEDPRAQERLGWSTYYLGDIPRDGYADHFVIAAREELGLPAEPGFSAP